MVQRFHFTTRHLLLVTAVLAVWSAIFVLLRNRGPLPENVEVAIGAVHLATEFVLFPLGAAWIVLALGKKSILAAVCGAAAYIALIGYLSWFTA